MWPRISPAVRSKPPPNPSTPALLLMVVMFLVPFLTRARTRCSELPHRPKPPIMMLAPSEMSRTASSALATTLFIRGGFYVRTPLNANRAKSTTEDTESTERTEIQESDHWMEHTKLQITSGINS